MVALGKAQRFVMSRYLLRLVLIGVVLRFVIARFGIDLIGLLVRLSVPVINIFALTNYRLISKGVWIRRSTHAFFCTP